MPEILLSPAKFFFCSSERLNETALLTKNFASNAFLAQYSV